MTDMVRPGLLSAYRKILRPLVRILIRHGISFAELAEVLKNVYVEVAGKDFEIPERKISQSRVAILTGLTRKEVAKQEAIIAAGGFLDFASNLNRITRVLLAWHSDGDFTGPYGMPLDLPFDSEGAASFINLVRKHSGDMAARAMLDELLRVGAVERLASGNFRVMARAYMPRDFHPDALDRFGEVVRDFITTYEFNMDKKPGMGRFERIVFADDGLRQDLMPAFNALVRAKGVQLLAELDNWLSAQESPDTVSAKKIRRINTGVGIYHFVAEEDEE